MKKRIACLLLTLVMLVSLIPTAAITASAAGLAISEAGIKVIKDYMGFKKNAYLVGTNYYIGYGTPSVQGATITEANADKYLREKLAQIDSSVNAAISTTLVQKRHDALVWYTYVEGSAWMSSSRFVNAVNVGLTGSAMVDVMCCWDYAAGGYPDTDASRGTLIRRMAIANLYLKGTYSAANSGSFGYTVFDAGEGLIGAGHKAVQAFDCNQTTEIGIADPTWGANKFLGWYNGNALVTGVGSATAGKTLIARWQEGDVKVNALYVLPAYVIYQASGTPANASVVVYNDPISLQKIDVVNRDSSVTVVAEKIIGTDKWLELSTGGWVRLCTVGTVLPTIVSSVNVTITDDYVNIRKEPSVTSAKVGVAKRGETRTIVMTVAGDTWGYCSEGWIFLAYTNYKQNAGSTGTAVNGTGIPGNITGADRVNVRTAAGVYSPLATTLANGTAVTVYEQTTVNGAPWGRIDQGWVSMTYVRLNQTAANNAAVSTGSTAYVSSSVSLNVRSGPGTEYTKIGSLTPGTSVVILQKQTVGGVTWALIDQGWINMSYVSAGNTASGNPVSGIGGTVVNCATGVNIRAAAGTTNALVGVAPLGSRVTVTERTQVNGFYWGHIEKGWVCMDYIQLDRQWQEQATTPDVDQTNIVTTFEGYPAVTNSSIELRATASSDAKSLMTLNSFVPINILARTYVGEKMFGKVTVGSMTGWVDMSMVTLLPVNAKVTAAKANTYELPSVRSKFYAALDKGTYVTIGNTDGSGWKLEGGILWGQTKVTVSGKDYIAWISMNDVTMFKENVLPTGITTLNGIGYLTGTVTADSEVFKDSNGNVTTISTEYTLVAGHRVNILARNYMSGTTWAKVTVGSVTGWINMANVQLDTMQQQATMDIAAYAAASDVNTGVPVMTIPRGAKVTILQRAIIPETNEINHGITDVGYVYVEDNTNYKYWIVLDEGKLVNVSTAPTTGNESVNVLSGVVVTGKAAADVNIYEEAVSGSRTLLKVNSGSNVTILNWKLVGGITWGKVQVGNIVGWVMVDSSISFAGLQGTVAVAELKVYSKADKDSSVQILRINNKIISIDPALYFDGATLWGKIAVADKAGWIDLSNVLLNTPGAVFAPELVIASGKINSVNAQINVSAAPGGSAGEILSLPKGTAVNLVKVQMDAGEAWWLVDMGDKDGWVRMDSLSLNAVTARVTVASLELFDDLITADAPGAKVLYTLYRDETVTILNFKTQSGNLYGEVAYGETTGWIQITDAYNSMKVSLTPGASGTNLGGSTNTTVTPSNPTAPTTPATPTTPAADPVPAYIVCATTVNVRSGAGVDNPLVTTLRNGTSVRIYEQTTVLGKGWARVDQGWVCMDYVQLGTFTGTANTPAGSTSSGVPSVMTTVPAGAIAVGYADRELKVYGGAGFGYPTNGTIAKNASMVIYERLWDQGVSWARTDRGWIILSYVVCTGIGATGSGNMGTIARCGFTANIRSAPAYNGTELGKVMISSRVAILETSGVWARTALGWVNTDYILMDAELPSAAGITDSGVTDTGVAGITDTNVG